MRRVLNTALFGNKSELNDKIQVTFVLEAVRCLVDCYAIIFLTSNAKLVGDHDTQDSHAVWLYLSWYHYRYRRCCKVSSALQLPAPYPSPLSSGHRRTSVTARTSCWFCSSNYQAILVELRAELMTLIRCTKPKIVPTRIQILEISGFKWKFGNRIKTNEFGVDTTIWLIILDQVCFWDNFCKNCSTGTLLEHCKFQEFPYFLTYHSWHSVNY